MFNCVIEKIQVSMFSFQEREQETLRSKVGLKKKSLHGCFCVTFVCNESVTLNSVSTN